MLPHLLKGISLGLVLTMLVGPILVLFIQLSLRRGTVAALVAGLGVWVGDFLYILMTHYGVAGLQTIISNPWFKPVVGSVLGAVFIVMAVVMWFRSPPDLDRPRRAVGRRGLLNAFAQGFAVNFFNPFTVGFWSVVSVVEVHNAGLTEAQGWAVYLGIIGTIVITDSLKIFGARRLRNVLTPRVLRWVQWGGAGLVGVFGVVLVVRVWAGY